MNNLILQYSNSYTLFLFMETITAFSLSLDFGLLRSFVAPAWGAAAVWATLAVVLCSIVHLRPLVEHLRWCNPSNDSLSGSGLWVTQVRVHATFAATAALAVATTATIARHFFQKLARLLKEQGEEVVLLGIEFTQPSLLSTLLRLPQLPTPNTVTLSHLSPLCNSPSPSQQNQEPPP